MPEPGHLRLKEIAPVFAVVIEIIYTGTAGGYKQECKNGQKIRGLAPLMITPHFIPSIL